MILTNKQQQGLKIAVERYRNKEPYTIVSGYAGSGKSTLVKFIIAALGVNPEDEVAYVAYTGKAANVLQSKGCANATTAHKLLYKAIPLPNGKFRYEEKSLRDSGYKVIIVDEVSMLPVDMWYLLISHGIYVIALGDPGQLPPISKEDNNHVLDKPHIFLDEIMRQAQDSEIIRLSMWVREGKSLQSFPCDGQQVQILNSNELVSGLYTWPDQILCATNNKRIEINNLVRKLNNFSPLPQVGDKIIGLHNHWDTLSTTGNWALTNGTIGQLESFDIKSQWFPPYISSQPVDYMYANIKLDDNDKFIQIPIDYNQLITGEPTLDPRQVYRINKNQRINCEAPYDFAYAYAMTVWKAQGSEWDKVLLFEERHPCKEDDHIKYLYTGITRASSKLVIVKK